PECRPPSPRLSPPPGRVSPRVILFKIIISMARFLFDNKGGLIITNWKYLILSPGYWKSKTFSRTGAERGEFFYAG
ncbi:unnamed protein product, partial [Nesidiocoris tenuis]